MSKEERSISQEDLLLPFQGAEKPESEFRVGTEAEKFGVVRATGAPLAFTGEGPTVSTILSHLVDGHGWKEKRETVNGPVIALLRNESSITLEPGGQLELSGAPVRTIHETCAEFRGHMEELRSVSLEHDLVWLGVGFHPLATRSQLPWVPKLRYGVMKEYLPTRGTYAHDMMQRTSTVQANFDFSSEEDAMRKLRVSLKLSPIITAMFANSPFVEGRATGERSHRARVWTSVDPDRGGYLPFAWNEKATYRDYVEWALDCPMFLIIRGGKVVKNTGQPFRAFMADGFEDYRANKEDWQTHINTMFPEVRLKQTLEVRGADSQASGLVCALPALWKGILYDEKALNEADELTRALTPDQAIECMPRIADEGLGAPYGGTPLTEWAPKVLAIASDGLARINDKNTAGKDERIHLSRLSQLVEQGQTPADALLSELGDEVSAAALIRVTEL